MNALHTFLQNHQPKTIEQAFRQYQLCRQQRIDPPQQVMKFMLKYLDGVAATKHRKRASRRNETIEEYWRVQDLIALGMSQEQALLEVGGDAGKNHDHFKRSYQRWKATAGPEDGNIFAVINRGDSTV